MINGGDSSYGSIFLHNRREISLPKPLMRSTLRSSASLGNGIHRRMSGISACFSGVSPGVGSACSRSASQTRSWPSTVSYPPSSREASSPRRASIRCGSSSRTPDPSSGENESKAVLDAFFLGKAFAEALNERIGSTVGEFLSVIGQWQAEQQKQVQDFQEEVLERAKRAKERAALEVIKEQDAIKPSPATSDAVDAVGPVVSPPLPNSTSPAIDPLKDMFKD